MHYSTYDGASAISFIKISSFISSRSGIIGISSDGELVSDDFMPKRSLRINRKLKFKNMDKSMCAIVHIP